MTFFLLGPLEKKKKKKKKIVSRNSVRMMTFVSLTECPPPLSILTERVTHKEHNGTSFIIQK